MSNLKPVYSQWIVRGDNTVWPADNSNIVTKLESGYYDLRHCDQGFYMFKKNIVTDELLEFPSALHHQVLNCITDFWSRKDKFKEYNFAFKRGILLHGKPGSGKSCLINLCVKHTIEKMNGIILSLNSEHDLNLYSSFVPEILRTIEPDRPLFIILEDVENFCKYEGSESLFLNILDGIEQLENVIYIATTNYIEKLPERLLNRPSRFDRRIYVPYLTSEDREFYFRKKLKEKDIKEINIKQWVKDTNQMSIAHLAELIKSVVIFGHSYEESIKILKELNEISTLHSKNYEKEAKPIGFSTPGLVINPAYNSNPRIS